MVALLLLIVLLYIKNNYFLTNSEGAVFSYLYALALPVIILVILSGLIIYEKYLVKLKDSHRTIFCTLLTFLITVCLALVATIVLLSFYYQSPKENKQLGFFSCVPFYVALLIVSGFFIYISPGLLDNTNGIPGSQFFLIALYLLFAFIYPICYLVAISHAEGTTEKTESSTENGSEGTSEKSRPL